MAFATPAAANPGLRINELQVIGTHNSYHVELSPAEKALRAGSGLVDETIFEYSFAPPPWQLDRQDVRQLELDLYAGADLVGAAGDVEELLADGRREEGTPDGQAGALAIVAEGGQLEGGLGGAAGGRRAERVAGAAAPADRQLEGDNRCLHNS